MFPITVCFKGKQVALVMHCWWRLGAIIITHGAWQVTAHTTEKVTNVTNCCADDACVLIVCSYYRSVVCALALAATASLRAQSTGSNRSMQAAAATLHLQAAKVG